MLRALGTHRVLRVTVNAEACCLRLLAGGERLQHATTISWMFQSPSLTCRRHCRSSPPVFRAVRRVARCPRGINSGFKSELEFSDEDGDRMGNCNGTLPQRSHVASAARVEASAASATRAQPPAQVERVYLPILHSCSSRTLTSSCCIFNTSPALPARRPDFNTSSSGSIFPSVSVPFSPP